VETYLLFKRKEIVDGFIRFRQVLPSNDYSALKLISSKHRIALLVITRLRSYCVWNLVWILVNWSLTGQCICIDVHCIQYTVLLITMWMITMLCRGITIWVRVTFLVINK